MKTIAQLWFWLAMVPLCFCQIKISEYPNTNNISGTNLLPIAIKGSPGTNMNVSWEQLKGVLGSQGLSITNLTNSSLVGGTATFSGSVTGNGSGLTNINPNQTVCGPAILFEGDSLAESVLSMMSNSFPSLRIRLVANATTGGDTISNMVATYAAQIAPFAPVTTGTNTALILWAGFNDFASGWGSSSVFTNITNFVVRANADGFKVCMFTVQHQAFESTASWADKNLLNDRIRDWSHNAAWFVDADALLGSPENLNDASDNVHWNTNKMSALAKHLGSVLFSPSTPHLRLSDPFERYARIWEGTKLAIQANQGATIFGIRAGMSSTNANVGTFIGAEAGRYTTNSPTVIGYNVLSTSTNTALNGTVMGATAAANATNIDNSTLVGSAIANAVGSFTGGVGIGRLAFFQADNAYNSVGIGMNAGRQATNSYHSIFLGYEAGYSVALPNSLCIDSREKTTNSFIYGDMGTARLLRVNGSVQVSNVLAIGTNAPAATLHITGNNAQNVLQAGTTNRPSLLTLDTNGVLFLKGTNIVIGCTDGVGSWFLGVLPNGTITTRTNTSP